MIFWTTKDTMNAGQEASPGMIIPHAADFGGGQRPRAVHFARAVAPLMARRHGGSCPAGDRDSDTLVIPDDPRSYVRTIHRNGCDP